MYQFTKKFRTETLRITLKEMSALTGVHFSTISSFEHGHSTNYLLLLDYYKVCVTQEQRDIFLAKLIQQVKELV